MTELGELGWRVWNIDAAGVLRSPMGYEPWPDRTATATCRRDHPAPAPDCECGIAVLPTLLDMVRVHAATRAVMVRTLSAQLDGHLLAQQRVVIGSVVWTGPALPDPHGVPTIPGFRVATATVHELFVPASVAPLTAMLIERYGVPVTASGVDGADWWSELAPGFATSVCVWCGQGRGAVCSTCLTEQARAIWFVS